MTVQSTYANTIDASVIGELANTEGAVVISRTASESGGLAFGVAATKGTGDNTAVLLDASEEFLGITLRDRSVDPANPNKYAQYDTARLLRKGVVWVQAGKAVADGDLVYWETLDDTWTDTESSTTVVVPRARWDSTTTGAALAKIRLD